MAKTIKLTLNHSASAPPIAAGREPQPLQPLPPPPPTPSPLRHIAAAAPASGT